MFLVFQLNQLILHQNELLEEMSKVFPDKIHFIVFLVYTNFFTSCIGSILAFASIAKKCRHRSTTKSVSVHTDVSQT